MQDPKWSCEEDPAQVSCEWGNRVPRIPQRCGKSPGRCPIKGQESSGVKLRRPSLPQVIQALGHNSGSLCKQSGIQGAPILQPGSLRQESISGEMP